MTQKNEQYARVNAVVPVDIHKALKVTAAQQRTTISCLIERLVRNAMRPAIANTQ